MRYVQGLRPEDYSRVVWHDTPKTTSITTDPPLKKAPRLRRHAQRMRNDLDTWQRLAEFLGPKLMRALGVVDAGEPVAVGGGARKRHPKIY